MLELIETDRLPVIHSPRKKEYSLTMYCCNQEESNIAI